LFWVLLALSVAGIVSTSAVVGHRISGAFTQDSAGMQPTFRPGDELITTSASDLRRGDIIIFHLPAKVDPARAVVAKRVIGLPGDRVSCCNAGGRITVNGKPLTEDYIDSDGAASPITFTVTLSAGEAWVLGDNRVDSLDSREYGPIAEADIVGRVMVVRRGASFVSERTPRAFIAVGLAPPDTRPGLTAVLIAIPVGLVCWVLLVSLGIFGFTRMLIRRRRARRLRLVQASQAAPIGPGVHAGPD
jgi:signal peptidase I